MISFIIIGRNEGWKLTKCFESVFNTIESNDLANSEIIYVDSKSVDDSIKRAQKFNDVKIYQITGECSVAHGRNIGAKEAKGDVFFFLDADVELVPEFLTRVLNNNHELKFDLVAGKLINYYYNSKGKLINKDNYIEAKQDTVGVSIGGIHLMKRSVWDIVKSNNTKYKNAFEDTDMSLRLHKFKIKSFKVKEIMGIHHTISYDDTSRLWVMLFSGQQALRGVLYRDHIFNKNMYKILLRHDYSALLLLFSIVFSLMFSFNFLILYFLVVIVRSFGKKGVRGIANKITKIPYYIIRDILIIFSIFFYYPSNTKTNYSLIN